MIKILDRPVFKKLLGLEDTPNRIALGFGLGLFLGVLPGTGAIAAVVSAAFLRINKPASLAGALLVNTWINVVAFPAALVIGAFCFGINVATLKDQWAALFAHFSWQTLLSGIILKSILAVFVGYGAIGIIMALAGYFLALYAVKAFRPGSVRDVST
jgi:uncharacterized protein (DUF2062 family)